MIPSSGSAPQFLSKPTPFVHLFIAFGTNSWHLFFHVLPMTWQKSILFFYIVPRKISSCSSLFWKNFFMTLWNTCYYKVRRTTALTLKKKLFKHYTLIRKHYRVKYYSRLLISRTWVYFDGLSFKRQLEKKFEANQGKFFYHYDLSLHEIWFIEGNVLCHIHSSSTITSESKDKKMTNDIFHPKRTVKNYFILFGGEKISLP